MASNANRTIVLKGSERGRYEEYLADAAITPGHLLTLNSTNEVLKHATAGGLSLKWFACEDSLQGKTIDDAYAAGDIVRTWLAVPGDWINALLAASATAVVVGDYLCPAADGTLKKFVGLTDSTGGTASATTIANLANGSTYSTDHPTIENNLATITAVLNLMKYGCLAIANEAVDNSGGGSAVRCSVTII
jgi:hypothetical protein